MCVEHEEKCGYYAKEDSDHLFVLAEDREKNLLMIDLTDTKVVAIFASDEIPAQRGYTKHALVVQPY